MDFLCCGCIYLGCARKKGKSEKSGKDYDFYILNVTAPNGYDYELAVNPQILGDNPDEDFKKGQSIDVHVSLSRFGKLFVSRID